MGCTKNIGDQTNEMSKKLKPVLLSSGIKARWADIGINYICIVLFTDGLQCFGNNTNGQLGQGDKVNRGAIASNIGDSFPMVNFNITGPVVFLGTGRDRTCALLKSGVKQNILKCFGFGANGALGYGDTNNRGDDPNEMGYNLPSVYLRYVPPTKSPSQAPTFKPTKLPTRKPQ